MVSRSYAWIATNGGAWSLASNWDDLTDGIDPSLTTPGAQDNVSVTGATSGFTTVITGSGNVQAAAFFNSVALSGGFTFGTLSLGTGSSADVLTVDPGATVNAGTALINSGSVFATGLAAQLNVTGAMTLGIGQTGLGAAAVNLDATSAARLQLGTLTLNASTASIYVDPASAIEVGQEGGAISGALTIDPGAQLAGQGDANAYGAVINNGTITANGGDLIIGATSGTGQLAIEAGAILTLNGATGIGQSVSFLSGQSTLAIATEFDQPQGDITDFAAGDAIDMLGDPISAATYAATGANSGILTLFYGNLIADTLTLLGNDHGDVFLTAGDGVGGTLITLAPETTGGGNPSPGTSTPDQYAWTVSGGGNWTRAANWRDLTSGANPARIAPGVNNLVTIAGGQTGSFSVIAGPANAASLTITGDIAMAGTFAIGTLSIGTAGASQVNGVFDLLPGTAMTASAAAIADGALSITGSAALIVGGTLALGGGPAGIGLPITALSATAGSTITCAALTLGGGAGNTVTTDPTATIEIGTAGGAAPGAVTIDHGATLTGNGQVNPFGSLIDNGIVAAALGTLTLGTVAGTGALSIGAGASLVLDAGTALPITMTGAGATLGVADELVALTGTITGYATGDAIDIENDPITSVSAGFNNGVTAITLYYDSTPVAHFDLAGSYSGQRFFLVPDGAGGTELLTAHNNGGGGGGGQGSTDLLSWAQPVSGAWNRASNWFDITTNTAATAPPGTLDPVQIIGPSGNGLQTIGGPAACASLACFGNTLLNGAFTTGTLTIGGEESGASTLTAGSIEITSATSVTTTTASIIDGAILVGNPTGTLTVSGTLTLGGGAPNAAGPAALLSATNGGVVQLAGLALGGGSGDTLNTDLTASIEIGTLGSASAGAVTIDPGISVAGNGAINQAGLTIDNGTLTAEGGTLTVGAVSGTGTLDINAAATLALNGAESCPIDMIGAGATLLLEGSLETPAAPLEGFVQGDLIVTGSSQIGVVAYQPGAGNIGTLTLYNGTEIAGILLLAGNFADDVFVVEPDGDGSAITVQANDGGPSAGTTMPDDYAWIGGTSGAWNIAANWTDISADQTPAAIAPGVNDIVTVTGGATAYTTITGPANAASLTLLGKVALNGIYAAGELFVGSTTGTGVLALGAGSAVQAAQALLDGGVIARGGSLTVTGTLTLQSGALLASAGAEFQIATLLLAGTGDDVSIDATSSLEVGTVGGAALGDITVDAGAELAGAGVLAAQSMIIDQGTITAAGVGDTLTLGAVSGAGTLLVGVGATMVLQGAAASALLIDFAGPGTLTVTGLLPQAGIAGFGDGDAIDLPIAGITSALYAATAPNVGILTLDAGSQAVASLTLVGVGEGQAFSVAGLAGGTVITTETEPYGGGGSTMRNDQQASGVGSFYSNISGAAFFQNLPDDVADATYVQKVLMKFQETADGGGEGSVYVYYSPDGTSFGDYQPQYANVAVVDAPQDTNGDYAVTLPPGYEALLAENNSDGNAALHLDDGGAGNALIVGNSASDTIVGLGANDTLIGGLEGNSLIWAQNTATIYGGGNDTIIANNGPCDIVTAPNIGSDTMRSVVFLGAADGNIVTLSGADTLVAAAANSDDTVTAIASDTIFAQSIGLITFNGGDAADIVIGSGGNISMNGGAGNGTALWCDNAPLVFYNGGSGSAYIVGGSGKLALQGGSGAVTVYGGTGTSFITGTPGPSEFLVGEGASNVTAASGNLVWLAGAANDSLVANGGGSTIWGASSSGNSTYQAGSGPCLMSGGSGNDTFWGGAGDVSILGGSGADIFGEAAGAAGGAMTIYSFNTAADQIDLQGYSTYTSALVGGNEVLSLNDGTTITLEGIGSLAQVNIHLS